MSRVQELDRKRTWGRLSLVVTDDEGMRPVNLACFGRPDPTDVISLSYAPVPGEEATWTGEIVVNADRAASEGRRRDGGSRELALYIAHGCQHLAGASDRTPALRASMRRRERAWLQRAAATVDLDDLMKPKPDRDRA